MKYHTTVDYRTRSGLGRKLLDIIAESHNEARTKARNKVLLQRGVIRIDCVTSRISENMND